MSGLLSDFGTLDIILSAIIILSVFLGLCRGFSRELISLLTWVAAVFAAVKYSVLVDNKLVSCIQDASMRHVTAILLVFIVVFLIGCLINKLVHTVLRVTGFGLLDRLLGAVFGFARGVLFATLILILMSLLPMTASATANSKLAPHFAPLVAYFSKQLPQNLKQLSSATQFIQTVLQSKVVS